MAEQDRKGSLSCRQSAQNVQSEEEPRFKCNECGRGYRHAGSLSNHRRTHEVGLFQCSICGKENWNVSAMKNHLRSHGSFKKHSCADCGKSFRLATQLLKHERVHLAQRSEDHSYRNTWEEKSTNESESDQQPQLNEHSDAVGISIKNMPEGVYNSQSESCNDAVNRPFCCNLCNRSYIHQRSLINHNKTHQLGIFECTVCFKLCTNMGALYNHQRTHKAQGERDRTLTAGPLTNKTLDQFLPHSQDAPGNFCQLCHTLFPNNMEFQEHIQMHKTSSQSLPEHMEIYKPSMASPESPVENAPPLSLTEHPSGFNQALNNTTNSHDKEPPIIGPRGGPSVIESSGVPSQNTNGTAKTEENPAAGSEERPFKCHTCGKSYRHSGSLINHKRSHQVGVYTCSVCCKNYPHLAALKSHLRLHRNQRPSFHHQAEQDWLSPEPLTPDRQQGCFYSLNEPKRPVFGIDQEKLADNSGAICEEQSDQDIACLPPPMPRHMCADCGETFADVADIRTHSCPFRSAAVHHVDALNQRTSENPEINLEFDGSHSHFEQENISAALLNGNRKDDYVDEDDDGDQYQCSVCGNSYSTMTDLRSHLQGHRLSCDAPQSSNEETKDDELGEMTICSACGETLLSRQDFISHHLLHMKGQADFLEDLTVKSSILESKEEACIICSSCGISCNSYHHLNSHGCTAAKTEESASCKEEIKVEDSSQQEEANLTRESGDGDDRQFKCDQCGRSYRHAGSLLNHKKSHKTGVFRCIICQKRFYNLLALKNHQRSHFDVKRHACHECGKAFKIQKQLLNHLRRHKENQGEIQDLSSQTQALMPSNGSRADERMPPSASDPDQDQKAEDQMQHTEGQAEKGKDENDKRPYSCDQCGRTYRHAGSLVNHRNSHKTGEYYCSICTNTYSNQLAMKNHLRSHFASKKHLCQKCGKGFRVKKQLLSHVCAEFRKKGALGRTGRRCRNFTCKTCKKAFLSVSQLMAHACDGSSDDRDSEQNASPGEEERPFRCNVCHRTYRHAGSLLNHKNTHKTGHFSCTFCSKPFTNLMALRSHTRIHTQKKKYACLPCGKAFRLASVLQNHQRVHSRALSHFSCASCGKSFQGSFGQRTHRCHRGQGVNRPSGVQEPKSFMCDLCGRSYRHAGSLLNHKKSHSEDLYPSTLCLQTFPDPLSLQLHSQVRRQCCPECGKTFCVSAHLQSHMKVHFKNRAMVCSLCLQSFPNTASYQEHHTLHHAAQGSHQQDMEDPAESNIYSDSGLNQSIETVLPRLEDNLDNTDLQTGESSLSKDKSHVCEHCGRTYRHPGSLLNHKNSHKTGSFFCSVCHKKFTNLMALKNHRRIHTEPKRYQCLTCGKAFRVSTQLLCHQRIHTKEKPFTCLLCSKSFSSKSNLRSHQKMHQNVPHGEADAFKDLDLGSPL